jgi:signal transduction histidine kinase
LTSIEKALNEYLDSLRVKAEVELEIRGDERRASPVMLEETFLIVREAVRNALTHGVPQGVQILVEITSGELRAQVVDDGRGFELDSVGSNGFAGIGIASMQERVALMDGQFRLSSRPGGGTCVEVCLPLKEDAVPADAVYEYSAADTNLG